MRGVKMRTKNMPITSREMRALEANAEYYGISLLQLMENAGASVAQEVAARFTEGKKVAVFCGLGGNGGDGFVAARHLLSAGYKVAVVVAGRSRDVNHEAAKRNLFILDSMRDKIDFMEVADSSAAPKLSADVIVDALLGTGTKGKIKPPISQIVDCINGFGSFQNRCGCADGGGFGYRRSLGRSG